MPTVFKIGSGINDLTTEILPLTGGVSVNRYDCFNKHDGSNYQVPAGKELIIIRIESTGFFGQNGISIYYGDNAKDNDVAAPTNAIRLSTWFRHDNPLEHYEFDVFYKIPANKYPHVRCISEMVYYNVNAFEITP